MRPTMPFEKNGRITMKKVHLILFAWYTNSTATNRLPNNNLCSGTQWLCLLLDQMFCQIIISLKTNEFWRNRIREYVREKKSLRFFKKILIYISRYSLNWFRFDAVKMSTHFRLSNRASAIHFCWADTLPSMFHFWH